MDAAPKVSYERLVEVVGMLKSRGKTKADLARALGKGSRPGTINDWVRTKREIEYEASRFEEAVARLFGDGSPRALDPLSFAAGVFVGIEADAESILRRLREARQAMGLSQGGRAEAAGVPEPTEEELAVSLRTKAHGSASPRASTRTGRRASGDVRPPKRG